MVLNCWYMSSMTNEATNPFRKKNMQKSASLQGTLPFRVHPKKLFITCRKSMEISPNYKVVFFFERVGLYQSLKHKHINWILHIKRLIFDYHRFCSFCSHQNFGEFLLLKILTCKHCNSPESSRCLAMASCHQDRACHFDFGGFPVVSQGFWLRFLKWSISKVICTGIY